MGNRTTKHNSKDGKGLYDAVGGGESEEVERLLKMGVKPSDYKSDLPQTGRTALHCAAGFGRHIIVRMLLAAEADVNSTEGVSDVP